MTKKVTSARKDIPGYNWEKAREDNKRRNAKPVLTPRVSMNGNA